MNRDKLIGTILILATTATWGGAWVTARAAAHDAPSLWMAVGRFMIAALALLPIAWLLRRPISLRHDTRTWLHLGGMALTGAIGYNLFFLIGIEKAFASDGAVITPGLSGFAGVIFVWLLDGIAPRKWAIYGGFLAMTGAAIIGLGAWQAGGREDALMGFAMFVLASVIWGIYTALGRRLAGKVPAVESVFWATAIAAMLWAPIAWLTTGAPQADWAPGAYWNMLYLGLFATSIGFVTWYMAVQRLGADRAGPGLGLVPVFGVGLAVIFLNETLQWSHLVGGIVVVAGILLSNFDGTLKLRVRRRFAMPADELWQRIANFGELAQYTPDLASSKIIEGPEFGVGTTRVNLLAKPVRGLQSTTEKITRIEGTRLDYELIGGVGPYQAEATWQVIPDGYGCRLEYEARFACGMEGLLWWPLTKFSLKQGFAKLLNGMSRV